MIGALVTVIVVALAMIGVLLYLLARAARRLLEFDEVWKRAMPVLFEYAEDLRKMLSADLLTDNPEVVAFHKRNLRALTELDAITREVGGMTRRVEKGPPPDVE